MRLNFYIILFALALIGFAIACTKDNRPTAGVTNKVVLTTGPIVSIGSDSAICGGKITSDGGDLIAERGICWSTSTNPIVSQNSTKNGAGTGTFSGILKTLLPNTSYYVRAYAKNAQGTIYGNQLTFKTNLRLPIIQTNAATSITQTAATTGGSSINNFGSAIIRKGICWSSTNTSPDLSNNVVLSGTGTSNFSINIQSFAPNTVYYARAFATNAAGTGYGNTVQFKTLPALIPSITTTSITNIGRTTASSGGNITSDGGASVTQRGVCWNTTGSPTISNSKTIDGSGVGVYSSSLSNLSPSTTYYVRAYATNSVGTSYGGQLIFTTLSVQLPSVTTSSITSIGQTSATAGGNVVSDGGSAVIERGVCWNTTGSPTINSTKRIIGSGIGSFSSTISGLTRTTTYYVRAYARNSLGVSYGAQVVFRTL